MAPSSKKRKASEIDNIPDTNGHPTLVKGRRKTKKPENLIDTAPAPDHGYTVESGPGLEDEGRAGITLWNELDWTTEYTVHPREWEDIKSYRNFILPSAKDDPFRIGETVYIARHKSTPAPPIAPTTSDDGTESSEIYEKELVAYGKALLKYNKENFWLGKILQIRADVPEKVLVLVAWLYWPYELPHGYGQPWFGDSEVFPSNLMDVIDASTVSDRAKLVYLDERQDTTLYEGVEQTFQRELAALRREQEKRGNKKQADDAPPILFWRQTFDAEAHQRNPKLKYADTTSALRTFCRCQKPNHPDKKMLQCANRSCLQWSHDACLVDDVGARALKELTDGAIDQWAAENAPKETQNPLAEMVGRGVRAVGDFFAPEAEQSTGTGIEVVKQEEIKQEEVKQEADGELHPVTSTNGNGNGAAPSPTESVSRRRGRPKKTLAVSKTWKSKLGVSIITEKDRPIDAPPIARITEKHGQRRTWDVKIDCLICGETMD